MITLKAVELGFYATKIKIKEYGGKKVLRELPKGYKLTERRTNLNGEIKYTRLVKRLDGIVYLEETTVERTRYILGKF